MEKRENLYIYETKNTKFEDFYEILKSDIFKKSHSKFQSLKNQKFTRKSKSSRFKKSEPFREARDILCCS